MAAPNVAALAAYAGEYEQALFSTLVNSLDVAQDITVVPNVKHKLNMTKLKANSAPKPFNSTEEYEADLVYSPRVLEVKAAKSELLIDVEKYRTTWMGQALLPGSGSGKKEVPFAQYVWGEVMKDLAAEINNNVPFFGFGPDAFTAFDAGATYAINDKIIFTDGGLIGYYIATDTTTAGQSPATHPAKWSKVNSRAIAEGFQSIIAAEITASAISPVSTGSVTDGATALAAFRALWRAMPVPYKSTGATIYCSYTDFEFLMDGIEDKIYKYTTPEVSPVIYLPGTERKCAIKPATWLGTSRRLICTPKENLVMGTDLLSDMNEIKVLEDAKLWTLPVGIKFLLGFQIRDVSAIRVGNQA